MIYSLGQRRLEIRGQDYFIADNATVIGSVILEQNASIWFNAVLRGDNDLITIGIVNIHARLSVSHATPMAMADPQHVLVHPAHVCDVHDACERHKRTGMTPHREP